MSTEPTPIVGVALGRRHEKTAISVVERTYISTGEVFNKTHYEPGYYWPRLEAHEQVSLEYHVRHLERHPSRYSKVAQRVPEIVREIGRDVLLVVDITATGRPAYSLILGELAAALKGTSIHFKHGPITVSGVAGGVSQSPDAGYLVPRRDLISSTQILFEGRKLRIAEGLSLAGTLTEELLAFKSKPTQKPDDLEGWREGKDDDLVLAVAISVWVAERFMRKKDSVPVGTLGYPSAVTG